MAKKKKSTYYLCQQIQTQIKPIAELNNLDLNDLKNYGITFVEDIVNGDAVSSTTTPTDYSIYDKKLTDLLESIIFNDEFWESEEEFMENMEKDENYTGLSLNTIIELLMNNFMIVRFDGRDKKYNIFTNDQLKNTIDQIISSDLMDLNEQDIDFNIISTLDDDVVDSLTEPVDIFINKTLIDCLGKFNEGAINIEMLNEHNTWPFSLIDAKKKKIRFGKNNYEDAIFRAKIYEYLCFEKIVAVVAIKTDSNYGKDGHFYEQYGFVFDMGNIVGVEAKTLMELTNTEDTKNKKNAFVFCDINGNRIIGD